MKKIVTIMVITLYFTILMGCAKSNSRYTGKIYLYGEQHGVEKIINKELTLWQTHYQTGLRHLFLELPYYTAEYINLWMAENDNTILEEIYRDLEGTAFHNKYTFEFFIQIKIHCPKTVFHGTDVGHQYGSTGNRFLQYLETHNKKNSFAYQRTQEIIRQGIAYYNETDVAKKLKYRENMLVENFIYELKTVDNADIMGIYGSVHTNIDSRNTNGVPICMASQLKLHYKNNVVAEDLSILAKEIEPIRVDTLKVGKASYTAYYYGKQDLTGFKDFAYREFWQLENAYADLRDNAKTGDVLPYSNYLMNVEIGQVYVVEYTKIDETKMKLYYISYGNNWNGQPVTENILVLE